MKTVTRVHDGYAESVGGYAESEGNAFPEAGEAGNAMTNDSEKQRESETEKGSCPEPKDDDEYMDEDTKN
eukprot:1535598-Karenia_brevis.AAC.1